MMRSPWMPFALAAIVTLLLGTALALEPYFAGDVALTRMVQSVSPDPQSWATPVSSLAPAPGKYYVMAIVLTASLFVGGWRGLALVRRQSPMRVVVMSIGFGMVVLGCLARIALGLHWPSDVFLTSLIGMLWIWAAARGVLGRA